MSKLESKASRPHEDPDFFRTAVNFTAKVTAFAPRLIKKDYFCTLLLEYLAAADAALVFKGGTCLAKVHAGFYGLSEDLDFVIPLWATVSRSERSKRAAAIKEGVTTLPRHLPVFHVVEPLRGANNSTQYNAVVGYASLSAGREETIKVEVALREPLLMSTVTGPARTILIDPNSDAPLVPSVTVRCISKMEAFAEKFRAALSRREAAIRDFYDIDYAVRRLNLRPQDGKLIELVRLKLAAPGNDPADVSATRLALLRPQVESQLRPVLRAADFAEFDLDRAFAIVAAVAAAVSSAPRSPTWSAS